MAEPLAEAVVKITADKSALASGIDSAKKDVKSLEAPLSGLKAKLQELKAAGGKSSGLGQLANTLRGAGAVAAVSMIGQELARATGKAVELSNAYRRGEAGAADIAVGIGESLPVIGGFVEAGQNIRELFTHEKAQLQEINDEIAFGNKSMQERMAIYEMVRGQLRNMKEETIGFQDKATLLNTKGDKAKAAVQVDIEYKNNQRKLEQELDAAKEARRKALNQQQQEIEDAYNKGPKTGKDGEAALQKRNDRYRSVSRMYQKDIAELEKGSAEASKALDKWHDAAVKDVTGVQKELEQFAKTARDHLAVTDNEKVAAYAEDLKTAGYNAAQSAPLIQAFAQSLQLAKYGEAKQQYQDIIKQLNTIGLSARDTAINEFASKLSASRFPYTELQQFTAAYDALQVRLKQASVGDMLKQMSEQAATFGTTAMEALKKKLDFNYATPQQRAEAIRLQIIIEGQEKAQKVADLIKQMKEDAQTFDFTDEARLQRKLDLLKATPQQKAEAAQLAALQQQQKKAQDLYDTVKQINDAYQDAGKSDIQRQVDQMQRLAQEAGVAASWVNAIADAKAKLERSKVADFIKGEQDATAQIGKSEPDKAVANLKAQGVTDPKLLGDAWAAAAKRAGAELAQSFKTPFELYQDRMKDLKAMFDAKAIDAKTYNNAKAQAADDYQKAMGGTKSIEQSFKENLTKQFFDFGLGKQKKDAEDAAKAAELAERKKNNKAVADNTDALNKLNDQLGKGITGAFA